MNEVKITQLTCNYKQEPIGMDSLPYFSWKYEGNHKGFSPSSYQIIVSDNHLDIVWDSKEVSSDQFINIKYEGKALKPRTRYYWKVIIREISGAFIESDVSFFETGKLDEKWSAKWITAGNMKRPDQYTHAPYLRKTFSLDEKASQARLYITGLGYFEAYINGKKTGDDLLSPAFTNYDKTVLYSTYDVTDLLHKGENVLASILGNGWYNCFTQDAWNIREASWRHLPKMIAELYVTTESGKEIMIPTDVTWKSIDSPITFNSIRNGEYYDANLEVNHWNSIECDDSDWLFVNTIRRPGGLLISSEIEPIRVTKTVDAVNFWKTPENTWVFDMGQNLSGFVKLVACGKKDDVIQIIYNEKLMDDGISLNRKWNSGFTRSGDFQTDKYTKRSDLPESWSPRFTYHGFQYIELCGLSVEPDINTVKACVVHTDIKRKGSLVTSDDTVNKIIEMTHWSTISNFHGMLTDSPHREKNAWTGDASVSSEQTMFNYITILEFKKWLHDIKDSQKPSGCIPCVVPSTGWGYNWGNGPDWSSALTLIPWYLYTYYGDVEILEDMYETIKKHFDYMESMAEDNIINYGIGDWCAPFDGPALSVNMSSFKAPTELTDTAYFYNAADILSKMAKVLKNKKDVVYFERIAKSIKKSFRAKFFNRRRMSVKGNCQTSTGCMLYQGLAKDDEKEPLVSLLVSQIHEKDDHLDFGILGNKYVMNTLGVNNRFDLGIKMITQKTYPGFGNIIEKGATTLWETWNGTGSYNHHMFSDVVASLYKYAAGIRPDENEPGFKHIIMQPNVDCGLTSVSCTYESVRGTIRSSWKNKDNRLEMEIDIPYSCHATLILPISYEKLFKKSVTESDAGYFKVSLEAGHHHIK